MPDPLGPLWDAAQDWIAQASQAGWLPAESADRLAQGRGGSPGNLFAEPGSRPLVVAFFGGTGVGKSSLLNRLAGQPLARVGVERPTSREVTVYVHESVELAELPPELPVETVRVQRHGVAAQREVLWVDAPDIDSTEEANRRCALAWLPHIDLVCYVVSPERYRDDTGWRILLDHGHKHGWLFVLNRWDEGDAAQIADFEQMLAKAGFSKPIVLPTCCAASPTATGDAVAYRLPSPDAFERLQSTIRELLAAHAVAELDRLGHRARLAELRAAIERAREQLGDGETWSALQSACRRQWEAASGAVAEGLEWSMRGAAARFAESGPTLWSRVQREVAAVRGSGSGGGNTPHSASDIVLLDQLTGHLWDDWTQAKLEACLDAAEVAASRAGLPAGKVRQRLDAVGELAGTHVASSLRSHVRAALARPGTPWSRGLRRATGFLMAFLPLVALMWVGWAVVVGYYRATSGSQQFRGTDFLVHSGLLVLLAWAVPFVVDRVLRPSLEQTALRALRVGLLDGLARAGSDLEQAVQAAASEAASWRGRSDELLAEGTKLAGLFQPRPSPPLSRVIPAHPGENAAMPARAGA